MAKMYAKETTHIATKDGLVTVVKGQAYDSGSKIVKAAPDAFATSKDRDTSYEVIEHHAVEAATAAPGETRAVQKPAKKKPAKKKATV